MSSVDVTTLADARQVCLHLSDLEWKAILGLSELIGEKQVLLLLSSNTPAEHQRIAFNFIAKDNERLREKEKSNGSRPQQPQPLKLYVPLYKGGDSQNLPRWFVSVERAITAQQIADESLKVSFVISKLDGPARN
jgi:hypothetical protein